MNKKSHPFFLSDLLSVFVLTLFFLLSLFFSSSVSADCELVNLKKSENSVNLQACEKLAQDGDAEALWKLALFYETTSTSKRNYEKAFRLIERSANLGNPVGQYHLGRYYDYGIAVSKNAFEAVRWYEKAARQNQMEAFNALGKVYFEGRGVNSNYERASQWFTHAVEKNDQTAQFYVELIDAYGLKSPKNYKAAFKFLHKASETQNIDAWYYLGMLYLKGKGTGVNLEQAMVWLKKAAAQNHQEAKSEVTRLARTLAKKQKVTINQPAQDNLTIQSNIIDQSIKSSSNNPKEKSSGGLLISILIVIIIGALAVFILRQKNNKDDDMNSKETKMVQEAQEYIRHSNPDNSSGTNSVHEHIKPKETQSTVTNSENQDFYDTILLEQARNELETNKIDKTSWQQAMNEANGNHARAELLYLKFRVKQLQS